MPLSEALTQWALRTLVFALLAWLLCARNASAEAFPIWLKPINAQTSHVTVDVDGQYALGEAAEYIKGRYIPLANWNGEWATYTAADGGAFLQLHARDSLLAPGKLYVGVKIPRFWNVETGHDIGKLELYFAFNPYHCADAEDRIITLAFDQPNASSTTFDTPSAPLGYTVREERGQGTVNNCLGATALGGATAHLTNYALGLEQSFDDGVFLFAEFEVTIPASVYASGELRFGLLYSDEDYGSAGAPNVTRVMTIPNDPLCQRGEVCQLDWGRDSTYQRIDLSEPDLQELGLSVYNVGQMLELGIASVLDGDLEDIADIRTHDGGVGDVDDIAEAIWSRDVVCLAEIMTIEDRAEVVEEANRIRGSKKLPPMYPVNANHDASPNLMILSSWPAIASEVRKFSELDAAAAGPDDDVLGSDRGAKGVVWARLVPPPKCRYGEPDGNGICPENDARKFQPEWVDVFCTHTQAPCSPSGTLNGIPLFEGLTEDPQCESQGDQHLNAKRQLQFQALGKYIRDKRALTGPDGTSGFSRPAVVLGDLNQVGPRKRPSNWGNDGNMDSWLAGFAPVGNTDIKTTGQEQNIATAYRQMRQKLGNWERTGYDALQADEYISGYDLSADTGGEGSWIGTNGLGQVGPSTSSDCTPTALPNLYDNVRVDYVMLIPATDKQPAYNYRWSPAGPGRAQVDRHWMEKWGPTDDPFQTTGGCVSDHAEVFAKIQLVPAAVPKPANPFRGNRLWYRVAQLDDVNESDDTWGDDGTTDWYTDVFWLESYACPGTQTCTPANPGNPAGRCDADWPTSITPDGKVSQPGWEYRSFPLVGNATAKVWLEVADYDSGSADDYYDAHSRSPCKHTEIFFDHRTLQLHELGCGMGIVRPMDQAPFVAWYSKGNGDDGDNDVQIFNVFSLCSISQTPGCATEKTGP